ncbi:MAG: hypothetical protein HN675_10840, partial [Opitutae bacterium]|nr:hypothetical protein [Opitutae bacterium]
VFVGSIAGNGKGQDQAGMENRANHDGWDYNEGGRAKSRMRTHTID